MASLTMKKADIIVALIVIPICLYVFYESTKWPVPALLGRPFVIPRGVATFLLVAALLLLYRAADGPVAPPGESDWRAQTSGASVGWP